MANLKNAKLCVSGLSGKIYIAELEKGRAAMKEGKREVTEGEFLQVIVCWLRAHYPDKICTISEAGEIVAEMQLIKS